MVLLFVCIYIYMVPISCDPACQLCNTLIFFQKILSKLLPWGNHRRNFLTPDKGYINTVFMVNISMGPDKVFFLLFFSSRMC